MVVSKFSCHLKTYIDWESRESGVKVSFVSPTELLPSLGDSPADIQNFGIPTPELQLSGISCRLLNVARRSTAVSYGRVTQGAITPEALTIHIRCTMVANDWIPLSYFS